MLMLILMLMFDRLVGLATLYWNSMSPPEKEHIVAAYSFELGKCDDPVVHETALAQINNVSSSTYLMDFLERKSLTNDVF